MGCPPIIWTKCVDAHIRTDYINVLKSNQIVQNITSLFHTHIRKYLISTKQIESVSIINTNYNCVHILL